MMVPTVINTNIGKQFTIYWNDNTSQCILLPVDTDLPQELILCVNGGVFGFYDDDIDDINNIDLNYPISCYENFYLTKEAENFINKYNFKKAKLCCFQAYECDKIKTHKFNPKGSISQILNNAIEVTLYKKIMTSIFHDEMSHTTCKDKILQDPTYDKSKLIDIITGKEILHGDLLDDPLVHNEILSLCTVYDNSVNIPLDITPYAQIFEDLFTTKGVDKIDEKEDKVTLIENTDEEYIMWLKLFLLALESKNYKVCKYMFNCVDKCKYVNKRFYNISSYHGYHYVNYTMNFGLWVMACSLYLGSKLNSSGKQIKNNFYVYVYRELYKNQYGERDNFTKIINIIYPMILNYHRLSSFIKHVNPFCYPQILDLIGYGNPSLLKKILIEMEKQVVDFDPPHGLSYIKDKIRDSVTIYTLSVKNREMQIEIEIMRTSFSYESKLATVINKYVD